ncbi:hypothetical protein K8R15_24670 [Escherichia coli]|nr:hypothetical protein J4W40_000360 [Escherichia coli]
MFAGDVSQVWVLVLVNAVGEPFAVVQYPAAVLHRKPSAIHWHWRRHWTLTGGTASSDIIHILMAEGGPGMSARSRRHWFLSAQSNRAAWRAVAETKNAAIRVTRWLNIRMRGRFPLS